MEEINSNEKSEFDNIDFSKLDIGQIIDLCLRCETKEDADKVLSQYEKYCDTPEIAHQNLGYIFGYCGSEGREKLYSLFPVNHPMFGPKFGRGGKISTKDAFEIGKKFGEEVKTVIDAIETGENIDEKLKTIEKMIDKK